MFTSAIEAWQGSILALILTGMGSGRHARRQDIIAAGGSVIAQGRGYKRVWGMPGAAAQAGICSAGLPLNQIAPNWSGCFQEIARDAVGL